MTTSFLLQRFESAVSKHPQLSRYSDDFLVVSTGRDPVIVLDFMVFIHDSVFENDFVSHLGRSYVISDHTESPPEVFVRFKSYDWLRSDLKRRLPISLWLFLDAVVVKGSNGCFRSILSDSHELFRKQSPVIAQRKYIEFRSERHNLRQIILRHDLAAVHIIKATIVKLSFEMVLLGLGKPYPYKKWLPSEIALLGEQDNQITSICNQFLIDTDPVQTIAISDVLVQSVRAFLSKHLNVSAGLLERWWEHLD